MSIRRRSPHIIATAVIAAGVVLGASARAHEGHAPLPTKGVQIDAEAGALTLSVDAQNSLGVRTGDVSQQPIRQIVLAYATIDLDWQQHRFVTTPIPGRITRLHVSPGEVVAVNQLLAEIESTELTKLQLNLLEAQNRWDLSAATIARVRPLVKSDALPGRELIQAEATHRENAVAIVIGKNRLRRLRLTDLQIDEVLRTKKPIQTLPILSPLAAVSIHTDLALGKVVGPTDHLFEVMDLNSVAVRIDVLERDLASLRRGQIVELSVNAFPGTAFKGVLTAKEPIIDAETHLGRVWAELPNASDSPNRLMPGMQGQASITVSSDTPKLTVPKAGIFTNGTESFVFVEEAATAQGFEYRKRNVAVGASDSVVAEITAGEVYPGDRVVTVGGHELINFFVQGVLKLSPEARKNFGLVVKPTSVQSIDDVLEFDGAIELPPSQRAVAASPLAGTIERILVNRAQPVVRGEVVAELSSPELLDTQYELLQADVELRLAQETIDLLRGARGRQVVAPKRILDLESQARAARFRRDSAQQRLETIGLTNSQITTVLTDQQVVEVVPVRAPIGGVVARFEKSLGQVIAANDPLFEIHDLSRFLVRAHLNERDAARVPIGAVARVRIVADPSFTATGKVVRNGSSLSSPNRTASAWIELSAGSSAALYHDMLARVTLATTNSAPVLALPSSAIVREGTRRFVFVEDSAGELIRRTVTTGRTDDRWVEITGGLKPGELVAITGANHLQTAYASLR
jgi:membrane fusion protein, heavy metal efflux system